MPSARALTQMTAIALALSAGGCSCDGDGNGPGADARIASCDPVADTGCPAGQKCGARFPAEGDGNGITECVPVGTGAVGDDCELAADPGDPNGGRVDNCGAGLTCGPDATCTEVCAARVRGSCGEDRTCIAVNRFFEDVPGRSAGVCVPSCDPLNPETTCEAGLGCYTFLQTGEFLCTNPATGADALSFMDECTPQSSPGICFINSAPIGALAFLDTDWETQATPRITPFCRAVSTHNGTADPVATARGDASDPPNYCGPTSRVASANSQCRHVQSLYSNEELGFLPPGLGVCVPTANSTPPGANYNDATTFDLAAWAASPQTDLNPDGVPYCPGCLTREEFAEALDFVQQSGPGGARTLGRAVRFEDVAPRAPPETIRAIERAFLRSGWRDAGGNRPSDRASDPARRRR